MPADPHLDETRILNTLNDTSILLTPMGVRSLMSLVLMACYDRKVERKFMADMIDQTTMVEITVAKLETAAKLRSALSVLKPDLEPKEIDEEIGKLCTQWRTQRKLIADKFTTVTECPTTTDTLH